MKDNKDTHESRKPVKYTAIDWDSYRIEKEEAGTGTRRKSGNEQIQPGIDKKWAVDEALRERPAYDFASDKEFNKALEEADGKQEKKSGKDTGTDGEIKELKEIKEKEIQEIKEKTGSAEPEQTKRPRKKKSLGTKLDELGSSWVSTGNFRNSEKLDDKAFEELENNIIVEASKSSKDDFLAKAVTEVNEALRDEDGYEPLGEVNLADTFELPKLDIHFGDTQDLKEAKKDLKEIRSEDLKKEIEKLDLAASIEAQTQKEIDEVKEAENAEKIIVKSDELKKKRKKKKDAESVSGRKKKRQVKEEEPAEGIVKASADEMSPEEDIPVKKKKRTGETGKKRTKAGNGEEEGAEEKKPGRKSTERKSTERKSSERKSSGRKSAERKNTETKNTERKSAEKKSTGRKNTKRKSSAEKSVIRKSTEEKKGEIKSRRQALIKKNKGAEKKEPVKEAVKKKTGPSEFRKKSADWKDKKTIDKTARVVSFEERKKQLVERIKKVTPIQWGIAAMGVIIFITGIMTSAAYANYQGEENKAMALKSLTQYKDDESYEAVTAVTEEMIPEAAEEPEPVKAKALSLEMSSVEKDLKIKLVDDEDTLVKDILWSVTVAEDKGDDSDNSDDGEVYEDDDMDGTIYIENIAAGDYDVTLNPSDALAEYILPQEKQLVSVKAAIEYKVIANIKDEIKSEKEVNVALEDPNGNQAADVETEAPANIDTVEWFESTRQANGEEYIEATPDISKTAASVRKNTGFLAALKQLGKGTTVTTFKRSALGFNLPVGYMVAENEITSSENSLEEKKEDTQIIEDVEDDIKEDVILEPNPTPTPTPAPTLAPEEPSLSLTGTDTVAVGASVTLTAIYKPDSSTVSWSISDIAMASISDKGSTCQITGIKAGEVTVTAKCSNGKETSMKITITESGASYSDDAKLYDASKNALYVKDGDEYRLATYGDYKSGNYSTYYRKQEAFLYTGWQDIDGHTYYYKGDHTYVTGEQIIQGIKYNFGSDGILAKGSGTLGIDVSKYQPSINWASVKASGVSYVIIRCGYRGASTGVLIQDPYFTSHIKGAKAAGLKVGVYFFTTALNETEAVEEASMCAALCSGYGINYPIFMDCESSSRPGYNELSASERTAIIKAFCNTIKSAGYTPGVYANKTWLSSKMNTSSLSGAKIWLAQYNSAGPTYSGRYDLWQYTSKGHVDGISGNVDMNQSYLGY